MFVFLTMFSFVSLPQVPFSRFSKVDFLACVLCSMEMRNLKTAIEDNQRELNNLRSAVKNKLRKYGPRIPDVIARIHMDYKRGRFHRKPIGPVGELSLIKLLF